MKVYFLLFFSCLVSLTSEAQDFSLDKILQLSTFSSKKAVDQLKQQKWKLIYSVKEIDGQSYAFERLSPTTETKQYIQLKDRGSFNSLSITVDEPLFISLKSAALEQGFQSFYYQGYPGACDSAYLKDSSVILTFRENTGKAQVQYELIVSRYSYWMTGFMPQAAKRKWTESQRYDFMLKCIGSRNTPEQLRGMVSACSCGGGTLETNNSFELVRTLSRQQLIDLLKECFKLAKIDPY